MYRCGKTGITASVIDSADKYTEQNRGSGLGCNGAERNRRERQLNAVVGSHGFPRLSPRADLVVFCGWSGSCHRAGRNFSSWRLAKGARIRQADFVRAAFLRSATRGIWHRAFHADAGHRVARTGVDSVASVLGVHGRYLFYRSRAQHGDNDSGASLVGFARPDVFPFRSDDGCPQLGYKTREIGLR